MHKVARRIALPAVIATALLNATTGQAAADAQVYVEVAATLDGKWKALATYARNLDGTTMDRVCVRTYNSIAGAESHAILLKNGYWYAEVSDLVATNGYPNCKYGDLDLAGVENLRLRVDHINASDELDASAYKVFTG